MKKKNPIVKEILCWLAAILGSFIVFSGIFLYIARDDIDIWDKLSRMTVMKPRTYTCEMVVEKCGFDDFSKRLSGDGSLMNISRPSSSGQVW